MNPVFFFGEMKQWLYVSLTTNPKEWYLGAGVPAGTLAFSLMPSPDEAIKFLQALSLVVGLVFGYFQIRKARAESLLREKELRDSDRPDCPPDVGL